MIYETTPKQFKHAKEIAKEMLVEEPDFKEEIEEILKLAEKYEGMYDLMVMWQEENEEFKKTGDKQIKSDRWDTFTCMLEEVESIMEVVGEIK